MKVYTPQKSYVFGNFLIFVFPLILTVLSFSSEGEIPAHEIKGLIGFWVITLILFTFQFGTKIKVKEDKIQHFFFGFPKKEICKDEVEWIQYRNVFLGGFGFGKGLKFSVRRDQKTTLHSIPEKVYGKEAIEAIKNALS